MVEAAEEELAATGWPPGFGREVQPLPKDVRNGAPIRESLRELAVPTGSRRRRKGPRACEFGEADAAARKPAMQIFDASAQALHAILVSELPPVPTANQVIERGQVLPLAQATVAVCVQRREVLREAGVRGTQVRLRDVPVMVMVECG